MASSSSLGPDDDDIAFGSDETFQHLCDICKDDKHVEAKAFCTNCSQRLCFTCQKSHNRIKATKDHKVLTGENLLLILQSFGQGAEQSWRSNNSQGLQQSWSSFSRRGSDQSWRTDSSRSPGQSWRTDSSQSSGQPWRTDNSQSSGQSWRTNNSQGTEHLWRTDNSQSSGQSWRTDNSQSSEQLWRADNSQSSGQLWRTNNSQNSGQSWRANNNQSSGQSRRTDNSQGTEQLWRADNSHGGSEQSWRADDTEHCGRGSEQRCRSGNILYSRQSSGQPLRRQGKLRDIINIEDFDTGSVEVSAMEIAMKGNLLVCDYRNHKLMLFDSKYEPLSAVYLLSAPWSMALSTPRNAILSLPDTPCLQMVELDNLDRLTLGQVFQTTNKFHRLLKYNDDMIALSENEKCHTFSIIDIKGNIKRSIRREMKESDMFKTIYFIALSRDQSILYVIDFYKGCYGLTMSGEIIFKYTDKKMKDYVGIATDTENFLYISGPETNSIVVINSEGKKVKDLVTLEGMRPGLITYDALQAKLFVKKFFGSRIFVFTLTNKGRSKIA